MRVAHGNRGPKSEAILTNRLVGFTSLSNGLVAQLVERGAYTLWYTCSNTCFVETPKSRVQTPPGPHFFMCMTFIQLKKSIS